MRKGYLSGSFDVFHYGHLQLLKAAKKHCDYLIVGLGTDELVRCQKGQCRPIFDLKERTEMLMAIVYVDKVVSITTEKQFRVVLDIMPHICFVGADDNKPLREILSELQLEIPIITLNTEHKHTTDILEILKK